MARLPPLLECQGRLRREIASTYPFAFSSWQSRKDPEGIFVPEKKRKLRRWEISRLSRNTNCPLETRPGSPWEPSEEARCKAFVVEWNREPFMST